ncbi:hypothetical protein AMECASPLE_013528 [Ameca splendens]|uniref:Secreted protein n=1 Tax=Ameca splendens TaxID=208324 RepID=A0ABV0YCS2_9TELE
MLSVLICCSAKSRSVDAISKVHVHIFVRLIPNQPGVRRWTFKVFPFKAAAVWASPDHSFVPVLLLEFFTEFLPQSFMTLCSRFGAFSCKWLKGHSPPSTS